MDLRLLIQLKSKGMSNRKVAEALGVSRNTVNSYVRTFDEHQLDYGELARFTDLQLADLFPRPDYKDVERYEALAENFPRYSTELKQPGCTLLTLWEEYLERDPEGYRYTQFVTYYRQWAGKARSSGILDHKAGQKLFIDFAGKTVPYSDRATGQVHQAQVFVAILPASQYTYAQAIHTQRRGDLVTCITGALHYLGGVPKALVSDNLKSAVSKGHRYAPLINKTLKDLALHYGCVVDPTRPYRAQDKALVEGAVKLVYQRIYYPLSKQTFFSLDELNQAIREQLELYNDYRFQNRKTTRRQQFLEFEKQQLDPLPPTAYHLRYFKRAKVQKISHIYFSPGQNYYSVPDRFVGRQVEVQYTDRVIEVFYNHERIARHQRSYVAGSYTTLKEHMPVGHQIYSDWNPELFSQQAARIGPHSERYIQRLMAQYDYPEIGYKQAQGILSLVTYYSAGRVEAACRRGGQHHWASFHTIESILENNLDRLEPMGPPLETQIPDHENIRGADHYH